MAEGAKDGGVEDSFSFVDKVRYMMYSEQEKESFLIEKKEKEEKKKAKKEAEAAAGGSKPKKQNVFGQIKSFFVGETLEEPPSKASPEEPISPSQEPLSDAMQESDTTELK